YSARFQIVLKMLNLACSRSLTTLSWSALRLMICGAKTASSCSERLQMLSRRQRVQLAGTLLLFGF
ncbi:hypothetical protein, partial [Spiribacter pallidus]|uniref:hypothetical protein n=1 Tax=Spiribacter pallidus TaxID=1987936 RepID=UPI0038B41572